MYELIKKIHCLIKIDFVDHFVVMQISVNNAAHAFNRQTLKMYFNLYLIEN